MATNHNRGAQYLLKPTFSGLDSLSNPVIPDGVTSGSVIALGTEGLSGWLLGSELQAKDSCDDSVWDCNNQPNTAVAVPIYDGKALTDSIRIVAPADFFPAQRVVLDTTSPPTAPVYQVGVAPTVTLLLVGWTINAGLTGEEMEVGF